MLPRLILLFILLPVVELALLLMIAQHTTWWFTLGLIVVTGVVGASLARHEGTECLSRIQAELSKGRMPADSVLDALMIFVAGALLITPGVLTDLFGFSLLVPPARAVLKRYVLARFRRRIVISGFVNESRGGSDGEDVIDVEHRPVDPPKEGQRKGRKTDFDERS